MASVAQTHPPAPIGDDMEYESMYKLVYWPLNKSHQCRLYIRVGAKWEMLGGYPSEAHAKDIMRQFVRKNQDEIFDEEGQKVDVS